MSEEKKRPTSIRLTPSEKKIIVAGAKKEQRSINNFIIVSAIDRATKHARRRKH